jgi:Tol biopolymer transport system component
MNLIVPFASSTTGAGPLVWFENWMPTVLPLSLVNVNLPEIVATNEAFGNGMKLETVKAERAEYLGDSYTRAGARFKALPRRTSRRLTALGPGAMIGRGRRVGGEGSTSMHRLFALATFCGLLGALVLSGSGEAAYPGPNGLIAFRAVTDSGSQIFTIDPVSLDQVQLTHVEGDAQGAPHWSADNSMITFEFDPPNACAQVATMDAHGGNLTFLPLANGDVCEGTPTFSADGTRLFYEGYNGKHRDAIFSMNLNGSDRRLVTACEGRGVTDPETSPDGQMLAFTCYSREGSALFDSRIDGSHLRQLTPYSLDVGAHEDWSPDSRRIMFISTTGEGTPDAQINTATIAADGTDLFWVTNYPAGGLRAYGNSYSPDGRWIVMRIENGSVNALFKIQPNGNALTQITQYSSFRPRGMVWGSECPCTP